MSDVKVTFRDGTVIEMLHEGRPGGSYTKRCKLEHGWVTVENEYGHKTSWPSDIVQQVTESPT